MPPRRAPRRHAGIHARTRPQQPRTQPPRGGPSVRPPRPGRAPMRTLRQRAGCHRGVPAEAGAVQRCAGRGRITFRSAGNSSFFTSPVAAAMLPAPENAASPSWDACSFAFSATAGAGGARQCLASQREGSGGLTALQAQERAPTPPPPLRARGRGSAAGHGVRAEPQILCCGPRYVSGFSRVTSAPRLAPTPLARPRARGQEGPYLR